MSLYLYHLPYEQGLQWLTLGFMLFSRKLPFMDLFCIANWMSCWEESFLTLSTRKELPHSFLFTSHGLSMKKPINWHGQKQIGSPRQKPLRFHCRLPAFGFLSWMWMSKNMYCLSVPLPVTRVCHVWSSEQKERAHMTSFILQNLKASDMWCCQQYGSCSFFPLFAHMDVHVQNRSIISLWYLIYDHIVIQSCILWFTIKDHSLFKILILFLFTDFLHTNVYCPKAKETLFYDIDRIGHLFFI